MVASGVEAFVLAETPHFDWALAEAPKDLQRPPMSPELRASFDWELAEAIQGSKEGKAAPTKKGSSHGGTDQEGGGTDQEELVWRRSSKRKCAFCGTRLGIASKLKKCSGCYIYQVNAVWYCNPDCQRAHWKFHRAVCTSTSPTPTTTTTTTTASSSSSSSSISSSS